MHCDRLVPGILYQLILLLLFVQGNTSIFETTPGIVRVVGGKRGWLLLRLTKQSRWDHRRVWPAVDMPSPVVGCRF